MPSAWEIVRGFERELAEYTGAPYCAAVNSGTFALRLALGWAALNGEETVVIPKHTYRSVPMMAEDAGLEVLFADLEWRGRYKIAPTNIVDAALSLVPGMYERDTIVCLSFHPQKPLAISSGGGAILCDDPDANLYFHTMRHDGREEKKPIKDSQLFRGGLHGYMFPTQAAEGWHRLDIFKIAYPGGLVMSQPDYEDVEKKWGGE